MSLRSSRFVHLFRAVLLLTGYISWQHHGVLDDMVEALWNWLKTNWVFQLDSFEPLVVSFAFFFSMGFYYTLDMWIPWSKRWRIHHEVEDMQHWKIEKGGRFRNEILWYWIPIVAFDILYPRRTLTMDAPSFWTLILEVIAALIVYDTFFFIFHLSFHKVPFLYENFHAKHHTKKVPRACEAMRLSLVEEIVDVGCSIASINVLGCHPISRAIYNVVIVYLITELHSGYDMPWMLQNLVPFGLWAGSRKHDFHHRYGTKYYSKFFAPLDWCCDVF